MPEAWQSPPQYQAPYFDPSTNGSIPPAPYFPAPQKKRGGFWKVVTAAVIAGVAILVIWTVITRRPGDGDVPATVLSATEQGNTTDIGDDQADPDGDKLSNADEKKYNTNPSDPDTDKDGYTDGQEVESGYNPNGAGRLSLEAPTDSPITTDPNRQTLVNKVELSGVPLKTVFAAKGSHTCQVTGGAVEQNTVTVKVKDGKVRQETPVNGSTLVFIINGRDFYMNGFEGAKYMKLEFDSTTGIATGEGARVKNGIFASEPLILASDPIKVACAETSLADKEFEVSAEQLVNADSQ